MKGPSPDRAKREKALRMRLLGKTYAEIGRELDISRQRVQQLISPPLVVKRLIMQRANGCCQACGVKIGRSGHVHHKGGNGEDYNDIDNLEFLCISCHLRKHRTLPRGRAKTERNELLMAYRDSHPGISNAKIGEVFGIVGETVRAIVKRELRRQAREKRGG